MAKWRLMALDGADPDGAVAAWFAEHDVPVRQFRALIGRAQANPVPAPAMLAQIASQARTLLSR